MTREKSCFGFLFSFSIIIGIVLGFIIRNGIRADSTDHGSLSSSIQYPEDSTSLRDDTYLFLGVDRLDKSPSQLEGAWLVTLCEKNDHPEGTIHLILITLYPLLPEHVTQYDQSPFTKPHAPIVIDPEHLETVKTVEPISFADQTWSHVIVMDEIAMNTAIELNNPNFSGPIPSPSPDTFFKPWTNPEKSFKQQWGIITTLCEEPDAYGQYPTVQQILSYYGQHIRATLDKDDLLGLWQVVNPGQNDKLLCDIYPQLTH